MPTKYVMTALVSTSALMAAGCSTMWDDSNTSTLGHQDHREYLAQLYFDQAKSENINGWDIQDANYLQGRGVNALNGGAIGPRDWREVPLVTATPEELETARKKLIYASDSGAVNQMPVVYSRALVAYDCWVGQQKAEMNASHNLSQCRDMYYRYASQLPTPPTSREVVQVTQVPMEMKELHKVYFAWDSSVLTADAKAKLDAARDMLMDARNGKLIIGGHADASGPQDYNYRLSMKRAQAVVDYLGLQPGRYEIDVNAYGERNLPVPTADGVREQENRVAIIGIRTTKEVNVETRKTVPTGY